MTTTKTPVVQARFQCCGSKKCAEGELYDDGSLVLTESETGDRIAFDPERARELYVFLRECFGSGVPRA